MHQKVKLNSVIIVHKCGEKLLVLYGGTAPVAARIRGQLPPLPPSPPMLLLASSPGVFLLPRINMKHMKTGLGMSL